MRLLFMGTPAYAVPSLKVLHQRGELVGVCTQPDRPAARGKKNRPSPVKEYALAHDLPLIQPASLRGDEIEGILQEFQADFFVVVAYGMILPPKVLDIPERDCINAHGSLLPAFRGASPMQAAILAGCEKSGVSIIRMSERMDAGDVLLQKSISIEGMGFSVLHDRLAEWSAELLWESLQRYDELVPQPQDESKASYCQKIAKEDGRIDWMESAQQIERKFRAYERWPGLFFYLGEKMVKIHGLRIGEDRGKPGTVIKADAGGIIIGTGQGSVCIEHLQLPGKRPMSVRDYLLGNPIEKGTGVN